MSEKTNIAWATMTASPWFGCSRVSAGCVNCYAEALTLQKKWAGWGDNSPRVRSKGFWKDAYRYNRQRAERDECCQCGAVYAGSVFGSGLKCPKCDQVLTQHKHRMFTSLMDWLDPMAPIEWLADFLKVVHDCQNLDWLLLTKRPELWAERMRLVRSTGDREDGLSATPEARAGGHCVAYDWLNHGIAPRNVWFGVTVENQAMADKRIPILLSIPAKVRWLSVEPLLEPIDLGPWLLSNGTPGRCYDIDGARWHDVGGCPDCKPDVHWVVVGGESGPKRRDCGVEAIVNVAEQCKAAGVPVFVKQDVALRPGQQGRIPDEIWKLKEYPR